MTIDKTLLQQTITQHAPLGQKSPYPDAYDKTLLHPVERQMQRDAMGFPTDIVFFGGDIWNCYELSWLTLNGKPMRALASFTLPSTSTFLPESKSVKLYLNSLNNHRFSDVCELTKTIETDLSEVCRAPIIVQINPPTLAAFESFGTFYCIDELDIAIADYHYNKSLLKLSEDQKPVRDRVVTHVFKSHCLCTGQPDWGSIYIDYRGQQIDRESLLRYLISFHKHAGFSENCIEQIFVDLSLHCKPEYLMVFGRFTRRGGIDINPYRCSVSSPLDEVINGRLLCQ